MDNDNDIAIVKLTKDLKQSVATMTGHEARYLVGSYYQMQANRMRADHQLRSKFAKAEPHGVNTWFSTNAYTIETQIAQALRYYAEAHHMGRWAMGIVGIGPILAAGLIAHIDQTKPTTGHIWRFAGLDPTCKWEKAAKGEKGEKRPWNAALKTLCWKIGESFVKVSNNPDSLYGRIYKERKEYEHKKNDAGEFAAQAADMVKRVPRHAQRAIYKTGKLSDGHLHSRAKRYAVKLFLSHWHDEAYRHHFKKDPPLPYPMAILGHAHFIPAEAA